MAVAAAMKHACWADVGSSGDDEAGTADGAGLKEPDTCEQAVSGGGESNHAVATMEVALTKDGPGNGKGKRLSRKQRRERRDRESAEEETQPQETHEKADELVEARPRDEGPDAVCANMCLEIVGRCTGLDELLGVKECFKDRFMKLQSTSKTEAEQRGLW